MQAPVGRDGEGATAAEFVAAAASGPATLSIEGDPGIGKTTLFRYTLDLARAAGSTVLECSPTLAESTMSFVGLTDLLRPLPTSTFDDLPAPQRRSLGIATLREAPSSDLHDERAVGTGLATLFTSLALSAPLVVAIDDLQWLDPPSADVVMFAVRRLTTERIGILTCARAGETAAEIVQSVSQPHWSRALAPGGLSSAALFHIVRDRLAISLARPALALVTETSGGNPFAALELARTTHRGGRPTKGGREVGWLRTLTAARIGQLSVNARSALLAAACSPHPTLTMLKALGLDEALTEAESNGTVSLVDGRVVFAHPLLAAAVVDRASAPERRAMHARLASVSDDLEVRARHGAMAHPGRDEPTATALDDATRFAEMRGSSIAAAELARLALDRTPDPQSEMAWTRRIRLAELLHAAGDTADAARILEPLDGWCPPGILRARALLLLTDLAYQASTMQEAAAHASEALAHSHGHAELEIRCLLTMSAVAGDSSERAKFASQALALLADSGIDEPSLIAWAECESVAAGFGLGHGLDLDALDHALSVERTGRRWRSTDQVASVRPVLLKWADRSAEALAELAELRTRAEEEGNEGLIPYILGHIPGILLRLGRFNDAAAAAAEHLLHADLTGQENQRLQALYSVALVDAHRGRMDEARVAGRTILAWTTTHPDEWLDLSATAVLGFIALSSGDMGEARRQFDQWAGIADALCLIDPGISRFYGDHIEVLVACGALDEAARRTDSLDHRARTAERVSARAIAERCRALLAAGAGDSVSALRHINTSLELDDACPVAFERHRTVLLKGMIHRRAREKAAARRAIVEATEGFAALGANSWRERCDQELGRIGTRASSSSSLTVTEQRVAELAAAGLTTRQIAEQCFISPKTVEANLARIYRKLAISSRAELGARMPRATGMRTTGM